MISNSINQKLKRFRADVENFAQNKTTATYFERSLSVFPLHKFVGETLHSLEESGPLITIIKTCYLSPDNCLLMMHFLFKRALQYNTNMLVQVLTDINSQSDNALMEVLKTSNVQIFSDYFDRLIHTVRIGQFSKNEFVCFLLMLNKSGYNALNYALQAGNPENLSAYLQQIRSAFDYRLISPEAYCKLLTEQNNSGFSPFHQMLKSGNSECMQLYIMELNYARQHGAIPDVTYKNLIAGQNKARYTTLDSAVIAGNSTNLNQCLLMLHEAAKKNIITSSDFKNLFINVHRNRLTANQSLLLIENSAYFNVVANAFSGKIIRAEDLRVIITGRENNSSTRLFDVILSLNLNYLRNYLYFLRKVLEEGIINAKMLIEVNHAGFSPLHSALGTNNQEILDIYYNELRYAVKEGYIEEEQFFTLLTATNNYGFSPLHQVANYGSFELVAHFLNILKNTLPIDRYKTELYGSPRSYIPNSREKNPQAAKINALLNEERARYGFTPYSREKKPSFFNRNSSTSLNNSYEYYCSQVDALCEDEAEPIPTAKESTNYSTIESNNYSHYSESEGEENDGDNDYYKIEDAYLEKNMRCKDKHNQLSFIKHITRHTQNHPNESIVSNHSQ